MNSSVMYLGKYFPTSKDMLEVEIANNSFAYDYECIVHEFVISDLEEHYSEIIIEDHPIAFKCHFDVEDHEDGDVSGFFKEYCKENGSEGATLRNIVTFAGYNLEAQKVKLCINTPDELFEAYVSHGDTYIFDDSLTHSVRKNQDGSRWWGCFCTQIIMRD